MTAPEFFKLLIKSFSHSPNLKQESALQKLSHFLVSKDKELMFVLKGYAGTGKTSLIGTLVKSLWHINSTPILMAPTGRAAKVMGNYSNYPAQTIHRKIYYPKKSSGGKISFTLQKNKHKNAVFIVDEASMISDSTLGNTGLLDASLLDDLIEYV